MLSINEILKQCQVPARKRIRLKDHDPKWIGADKQARDDAKRNAASQLSLDIEELAKAQDKLYASDSWSVLVIFQALDAAGKDSTIKHVMTGLNPQGCQVYSFKHPSFEELDHTYLWRCMKVLPERGRIGIFNRSYYEEVLIVRVHPKLVQSQRIPEAKVNDAFWEKRYEEINSFEQHLNRNGTSVVKFFLNVSKEEQRERFLARIEDPEKQWKFSLNDLKERACWTEYQQAYEDALSATSTKHAPWYVIPADHKWMSRYLVARVLSHTLNSLGLSYPKLSAEQKQDLVEAKKILAEEKSNR